MRFRIVNSLILAYVGFALASLAWNGACEQRGRAQGLADAQRDVRTGRIGVKGFGKPMYWHRAYVALLSERYGVTYEHVAGCVPRPFDFGYIAAYNEAMKPAWEAQEVD